MPQNHLINISVGELLRLNFVLLRGRQQIVQKGHVEFKNFDKLDDAAIGNI
jgi:hypothetical protein